MQQNSTLKKLSEILNLSISTVSRALKDHPDISDKTKTKVKELAQALDYEPNSYAIQLRTNKSKVIGILLPSVTNFFYDSVIAAIETKARDFGYSVMMMQSGDDLETEMANLKLLKQSRISGLFASLTIDTKNIEPFLKLNDLDIPVIFLDRVPDYEPCNKIRFADREASRIAAEALIQKQKKHVLALFGHPNLSITQKRKDGFIETYQTKSPQTKLDISFPEHLAPSRIATLEAFKKKDKPDAVFCMGDTILIGVMEAIHQLNIKVPEEVAIIGISNGFIPNMYNPKITYVETSGYKLGLQSFDRMLACLLDKTDVKEVLVEPRLVEGKSL
ncbi:HTH-type transcriptional repressor PurR [mine drainage metagenome]|uniref:HTH-type transcriptional repressor PurR n=1 Tax=mine drainage metagenome TaxID=410659 RepID=A0A1J5S836_9ZZZZ